MKEWKSTVGFSLYGYQVHVVVSKDILASRYKRNDVLKSMYLPDDVPLGLFNAGECEGYIFLNPDADMDVISHESFHAVCAMMTHIGTYLEDASEECYAYALGFLTKHVYNIVQVACKDLEIKKNNKKKNANTEPK